MLEEPRHPQKNAAWKKKSAACIWVKCKPHFDFCDLEKRFSKPHFYKNQGRGVSQPTKMYIYAVLEAIHPLFLHKTIKNVEFFVYYYIFICTFAAHLE